MMRMMRVMVMVMVVIGVKHCFYEGRGIQRLSINAVPQAKEQSDVWKKTEAEFNVQKMIWQSLSLSGFTPPKKTNGSKHSIKFHHWS